MCKNVPTIDIYGAVRRPGTYSLSAGMTLSSIIRLAGGLAENAYLGQGTIVRRRTAKDGAQLDIETIVFDTQKAVSGGAEADIVLANKDSIEIRQIQKMQVRVSVEGRVQFPGTYILPDGSTVADLMAYAGGLIDGADLRAAVFTRESVRRVQQIRLEEMFAKSQERFAHNRNMLVRSGGSGESLAGQLSMLGLERLAQNMKRFQARGRIVMNINEHDFTSSEQNLTLENNDRLFIPQRNSTVIVMGRVFSPNAFVLAAGWTVEDYLEKQVACFGCG